MNDELERLEELADKFQDYGLTIYIDTVFPRVWYKVSIFRGTKNIGEGSGRDYIGNYQECLHYLDVLEGVAETAMSTGANNILIKD
jgi:hypothetical protein